MAERNSATYSGSEARILFDSLARISTVFGRLAHLAALREPCSDRYEHPILSRALGSEDANRLLRRSHHQLFAEWLSLSLAEQKSDLDEFLRSSDPAQELRFREMPPANARDVERKLYFTDIEIVLKLSNFDARSRDSRGLIPA